jgi:hypothetical protein
VALDAEHRVMGAGVVNTDMQLEMLPVEKLGIIWRAPPEATVSAASFAIHQVNASRSEAVP